MSIYCADILMSGAINQVILRRIAFCKGFQHLQGHHKASKPKYYGPEIDTNFEMSYLTWSMPYTHR